MSSSDLEEAETHAATDIIVRREKKSPLHINIKKAWQIFIIKLTILSQF
jgi:hypothetical protein